MKQQKPQHRIPYWCFEVPYEKPSTKGFWKRWQRQNERNFWKCFIKKESEE